MDRDQPGQGVTVPTPPPPRGLLASSRPLKTPPDEALDRLDRILRKSAELANLEDSFDDIPGGLSMELFHRP